MWVTARYNHIHHCCRAGNTSIPPSRWGNKALPVSLLNGRRTRHNSGVSRVTRHAGLTDTNISQHWRLSQGSGLCYVPAGAANFLPHHCCLCSFCLSAKCYILLVYWLLTVYCKFPKARDPSFHGKSLVSGSEHTSDPQ